MEAFPQKIAVAVFITAIVPDTTRAPWHILEEHAKRSSASYGGIEIKNVSLPGKSQPFAVVSSDFNRLATYLYQKCTPEDLALASMMVRPGSFFREDLEKITFSEARYGSVDKVFIICVEDIMLTVDFQKWMIENCGAKEVMEIEEADHMAMLSKPQQLCQCLITILNSCH
ncbi:hypothetical protein HPP92_005648 [Vanilla planifolia]|uniref:Salicylic acid-binding protein 2 n=1 Tax=Vanilla planifolia TaxID=51239 RepID=A0A835RSJ5_VANPL|nr:hypothetical protein HPP92_005648 [Vanilla planifolia]